MSDAEETIDIIIKMLIKEIDMLEGKIEDGVRTKYYNSAGWYQARKFATQDVLRFLNGRFNLGLEKGEMVKYLETGR